MNNIPKNLNIASIIKFYPEELKSLIKNSHSISHIISQLSLQKTNNSARNHIKNFACNHNISLPSYKDYRNSSYNPRYNKEEILKRFVKSDKNYGSSLRSWVLKFNLIKYKCQGENCEMSPSLSWGSRTITLHLDHINGENTDNRLVNLRFLCPNCHSLTETYAGKNKKNIYKNNIVKKCESCHAEILKNSNIYCEECFIKNKKEAKATPLKMSLIYEDLETNSMSYVAKKYFISRETLRKIIKNNIRHEFYPRAHYSDKD